MWRIAAHWWPSLCLVTLIGCANLEARKVPLEDRLNDVDDKIKGFRYYMPRPHLVVSQRVCVGQTLVVGRLLRCGSCYIIESVGEDGSKQYFDGTGQAIKPPQDLKAFECVHYGQVSKSLPEPDPDPKPEPAETFQFVMLPDFEEQIAIKDNNFAAKSKYELRFGDGWQLRSVSGSWDSTEVAVKALEVLSSAIKAAAEVREEQLKKPPSDGMYNMSVDAAEKSVLVVRVSSVYVEPGIYRLQKPSEMHSPLDEVETECISCGLLANLGIPVVTDYRVELLAKPD